MYPIQIRRILLPTLAILFFLCISGLSPFILQLPKGCPGKADAIVVLGGGTGDRVARSLDLFNAGYASQLVLTGNEPSSSSEQNKIHDARADFLVKREVPLEKILYVFPSNNSWLEANATLKLMQQLNWDKVIVVSDPPHMLRLSYAWGKVFQGNEERFVLVATEPEWWTPWAWWSNKTSFVFVLGELLKLGYYVIAY